MKRMSNAVRGAGWRSFEVAGACSCRLEVDSGTGIFSGHPRFAVEVDQGGAGWAPRLSLPLRSIDLLVPKIGCGCGCVRGFLEAYLSVALSFHPRRGTTILPLWISALISFHFTMTPTLHCAKYEVILFPLKAVCLHRLPVFARLLRPAPVG